MRMPSGRIALVAITRRGAQQAGALARSLVAASPLLPTPSPLTEECRGTGSEGFLPPSPLPEEGQGEGAESLPSAHPRATATPRSPTQPRCRPCRHTAPCHENNLTRRCTMKLLASFTIILIAICGAFTRASAENVYRCGNSYSQKSKCKFAHNTASLTCIAA